MDVTGDLLLPFRQRGRRLTGGGSRAQGLVRRPILMRVDPLVRQQRRCLIPRRLGQAFLRPATFPPAPAGRRASAWISSGRWRPGRGSCSGSWMRARLRSGGCVRARLQLVGLCVWLLIL